MTILLKISISSTLFFYFLLFSNIIHSFIHLIFFITFLSLLILDYFSYFYNNIRLGLLKYVWNTCKNWAAIASSTTRLSADNCTIIVVVILTSSGLLGFGITLWIPPPTARIHACGGLITALNDEIPNIPKLEIVNVPPWYSCGLSFPSRARVARSFTLLLIDDKPNASTFLTIGVIKPFGVATATEISIEEFNSGLPNKIYDNKS